MSEQQSDPALTPKITTEAEDEPDYTPKPSQILSTPSTAESCAAEYDDADDIRRRLGWRS